MSSRPLSRIALPLAAAVALLGCALDTGGGTGEPSQAVANPLTADASAAQLVIQGAPIDFGGVIVGSTVVRVLTVTNTGTVASAALSNIAVSGAGAFAVVAGPSPCQGVKLAPAAKCDVVVTYAPGTVGGKDAATLTVGDGTVKATAALAGIGIAAGVDYVIAPSPGTIALKPGQSGHVTFTVTNAGTAPGPAINGIGTDGDGSYSWWHVANDHCSRASGLGVLATCTFDADVTVPASPAQETGTYVLSVMGAGVVGPNGATSVTTKAIVTLPPAVDYVLTPSQNVSLTVAPGGSSHVTFTVANQGWNRGPAINHVYLDAISWFSLASDGCTGNAGLASGGKCTFDVDVAIPASATAQTISAPPIVSAAAALDPAGDTTLVSHVTVAVP